MRAWYGPCSPPRANGRTAAICSRDPRSSNTPDGSPGRYELHALAAETSTLAAEFAGRQILPDPES